MSKSKSRKKVSIKQKKETTKSLLAYFDEILNYKYLGLIISLLYLLIVGVLSFIFHTVGDYGIETDFFWGYVPSAK